MTTEEKRDVDDGPVSLPVFEGYTVDVRLREFRRVDRERLTIEFIRFDSEKGRALLGRMGEEWDWIFDS